MVLLHGGSPRGAERIAACWADKRKVPQIAFRPDWARHAKGAPFKRNNQMLDAMPIGVIVFPGSGSSANQLTFLTGGIFHEPLRIDGLRSLGQ